MDRATLHQRLHIVEDLLLRLEESVVFQRRMVATLEGGGHDAGAAKMLLQGLKGKQATHLADRDRLFKELANRW